MIYKKFRLDYFDWDIHFLEVQSKEDLPEIKKIFKKLNISGKPIFKEVKKDYQGGGWHICDNLKGWSMIFIYRQVKKAKRFQDISHEKRHMEDNLLQWFNIKDSESSAMLSHNIAKLIYKLL